MAAKMTLFRWLRHVNLVSRFRIVPSCVLRGLDAVVGTFELTGRSVNASVFGRSEYVSSRFVKFRGAWNSLLVE